MLEMTSPADLVAEVLADISRQLSGKTQIREFESEAVLQAALERLKDAPPEVAVEFALAGLRAAQPPQAWMTHVVTQAVGSVLRRKLQFTEDQVVEMIELVSLPHQGIPVQWSSQSHGILAHDAPHRRCSDAPAALHYGVPGRRPGARSARPHRQPLERPGAGSSLEVQGAWSRVVFQEISQSQKRDAWERIFFHAAELKSSEAPKKWRATAQRLVEELGLDVFLESATRWLAMGPSPDRPGVQISSGEADFQTGFLWFLAGHTDERLHGLLANFAGAALKKITALGAVSQKVGNACVNVLAELPGLEPVSQLSLLSQHVKYDTAQRLIEKALGRAAERAGVSREQIEEMSIPDCGLGPDGTANRTLRRLLGEPLHRRNHFGSPAVERSAGQGTERRTGLRQATSRRGMERPATHGEGDGENAFRPPYAHRTPLADPARDPDRNPAHVLF